MNSIFVDIGAIGTAVGALIAAYQLRVSSRQSQTRFEDSLTQMYRNLVAELPVHALLRKDITDDEVVNDLDAFYRYVDLSNEQVFLRSNGRVSTATWRQWRDGIETNLNRPAFKRAWAHIHEQTPTDFYELQRLTEDWTCDPLLWDKWWASVRHPLLAWRHAKQPRPGSAIALERHREDRQPVEQPSLRDAPSTPTATSDQREQSWH